MDLRQRNADSSDLGRLKSSSSVPGKWRRTSSRFPKPLWAEKAECTKHMATPVFSRKPGWTAKRNVLHAFSRPLPAQQLSASVGGRYEGVGFVFPGAELRHYLMLGDRNARPAATRLANCPCQRLVVKEAG